MSFSPNQQRAIITGASSGIGKATALAFAQAGIDVALLSRSQEKSTQAALLPTEAVIETMTITPSVGAL